MVVANAPFEVVLSGFSIHHQPDARKRTLCAEIYNLLTPGGLFCNLEHIVPQCPWEKEKAISGSTAILSPILLRISEANDWIDGTG